MLLFLSFPFFLFFLFFSPYFPRGHFLPVPKVAVVERYNSSFLLLVMFYIINCKQYGLTNKMNE